MMFPLGFFFGGREAAASLCIRFEVERSSDPSTASVRATVFSVIVGVESLDDLRAPAGSRVVEISDKGASRVIRAPKSSSVADAVFCSSCFKTSSFLFNKMLMALFSGSNKSVAAMP